MPGSDGRCPRFPSDSFSRYGFLAGTLGGKAVYGCDFRLLAPAGSTDIGRKRCDRPTPLALQLHRSLTSRAVFAAWQA